jgi:methylase of polypeptide subunit release factors
VIEVGVGCGCTLVEMLLSNKFTYVSGVDINKCSVNNTVSNLKEYGLEADVYQSDVLDN